MQHDPWGNSIVLQKVDSFDVLSNSEILAEFLVIKDLKQHETVPYLWRMGNGSLINKICNGICVILKKHEWKLNNEKSTYNRHYWTGW